MTFMNRPDIHALNKIWHGNLEQNLVKYFSSWFPNNKSLLLRHNTEQIWSFICQKDNYSNKRRYRYYSISPHRLIFTNFNRRMSIKILLPKYNTELRMNFLLSSRSRNKYILLKRYVLLFFPMLPRRKRAHLDFIDAVSVFIIRPMGVPLSTKLYKIFGCYQCGYKYALIFEVVVSYWKKVLWATDLCSVRDNEKHTAEEHTKLNIWRI